MRNKLKSLIKKFLIFLFLFFCLNYPNGVIFSKESCLESNQSLKVGISYLSLRKSFLDFPIVWKTNMPIASVSYQITIGKFFHQISLDYGRSTYIKINDSKRWGKNGFSILAFNYDFIWYKLRHTENPRFFWGLGACLENLEIAQKLEISPGKYNKYKDQYVGIGPKLNLFWKFKQAQWGLDIDALFTLPYASFGIVNSDVAFTAKSYLWWFEIKTNLYYKHRISRCCDLFVEFHRNVSVYGRSYEIPSKLDDFYSGGTFIFKFVEMGLSYNF